MTDQWAWWSAALKGEFGPIHENDPQSGYYRRKIKDGGWSAIAIWRDGEAVYCLDGGQAATATDVWTWCCRTPISYDLYIAVTEGGEAWPDLPPQIGHNLGLTPLETIQNELAGEKAEIERILKAGPLADKEAADRMSNWTARVSEIKRRADAERVAEKRPHDDAATAVQAKWKPVVDEAAALERRMKDAVGVFLKAEATRLAEERAKAAEAGEPVKAVANAKAGTSGRKIALRTVKQVEITDIKALAAFLAGMTNPPADFTETLKTLADRMLRAGVEVPGAKHTERQIAA